MANTIIPILGLYLMAVFILMNISFVIGMRLMKVGAIIGLILFAPKVKPLISILLVIAALLFIYKLLLGIARHR